VQLSGYLNGTHLVDLHTLNMKSDEVIDLLEHFEVDIIYDFDRLREGTPDQYSASVPDEGFELRFDESQVLTTIWCYIRPHGQFAPIDPGAVGIYLPESWSDAKRYALSVNSSVSESPGAWLRIERGNLWVHYEFAADELSLVTLMSPWQ
jgi:hypothetical protein